jgi:hypothetical protein
MQHIQPTCERFLGEDFLETAPPAPPSSPAPGFQQVSFLSLASENVYKHVDALFGLIRTAELSGEVRMVFEEWSSQWWNQGAHPSAEQSARLLAQLDLSVIRPSLQQEMRPEYLATWSSCQEICYSAIGLLLPDESVEDFLDAFSGAF